MQDILEEIKDVIYYFNESTDMTFLIDSIRIDFDKQHKLTKLKEIGEWEKIGKHSNILHKLKKRLRNEELTSAHRLKGYDVYYYSLQDPPKYRRARMVIFGLSQYHRAPVPQSITKQVLQTLKDVSNIDVCIDFDKPPNLAQLAKLFNLYHYKTSTYINNPLIAMVERIIFYDKALKNSLECPMWRMEALVIIPSRKVLALPLNELTEIATLAWGRE